MPYPPAPEIQTSYTAQEQALGDGTLPGQELDVDLASIRSSVTAIIEFLKTSLRSDGRLANGSVTSDTLASSLIIGFDPPEVWATGQAYTTRSTVFEGFGFYLCTTAHESGTFATDLASGRWALLADLTPPGGALIAANNLSDLVDAGNARSNLGLGSVATANAGTGADQHRTNAQNEAFFQPLAATLTAWAALTRASGFDTFVANPTSANLRALLTDETGTGAALFAGGAMGTPSSLVLTNATGLTTSGIAAGSLTTASETIAANDSDTQVPTSSAVFRGRGFTWLAPQATTSGSTWDFTGIPSWATEVIVLFNRFRQTGGSVLVQLRVGGAPVTTGYTSIATTVDGGITGSSSSTTGFGVFSSVATYGLIGDVTFQKWPGTNQWLGSQKGARRGTNDGSIQGGGEVTLSGVLDGVRVLVSGGTGDQGSLVVGYR